MRSSRSSLKGLLAAAAIGMMGAATMPAPATGGSPMGRTVDAANPNAPGNPMLASSTYPAAPHDRRRWLQVRRSRGARHLRKSTGTHKQNRRRALAGL